MLFLTFAINYVTGVTGVFQEKTHADIPDINSHSQLLQAAYCLVCYANSVLLSSICAVNRCFWAHTQVISLYLWSFHV